jgi:hypothetical protein
MSGKSAPQRSRKREVLPVEAFSRVGCTIRMSNGKQQKIPTITLRGKWLKALGFPTGAPIFLLAEAHGRMAIHRPGLHKPRCLRIVAPKTKPRR